MGLHPVGQALLAGGVTWGITALGAALVFPFRDLSRGLRDAMLGFAAGVMIATSVGLLLPWLLAHTSRDPALGSGPVATIIQDVLSLLISFLIVQVVVV